MALPLPHTPREKIIFSTSLTLVLTAILLIFVAWPSIREIKSLNDQIYYQRLELEKLYQKGQLLKQTLKEYEEVKPTTAALDHIYIKRGEELNFITTLENIASTNKLEQNIRLGSQDPKKQTNQLPMQLELKGSLSSFVSYLAGLEALDYYLNIDTVRLSGANRKKSNSNETANSQTNLNALLLAAAFFRL
jgi:Tfp pilus assembly protein PilO